MSINKRAEYLTNQMQDMTIPQIQKYIKDQQAKGILTENVKEVLIRLKDFQDIKLRKSE